MRTPWELMISSVQSLYPTTRLWLAGGDQSALCPVVRPQRSGQVLRFSGEITRECEKCVKLSLGHFFWRSSAPAAHLSPESPVT